MPRYNVRYKNKYACYSTISDNFITKFMNVKEYDEWRIKEYGEVDFVKIEIAYEMQCLDFMELNEAIHNIILYKSMSYEDIIKLFDQLGISEKQVEKVRSAIYDETCKIIDKFMGVKEDE